MTRPPRSIGRRIAALRLGGACLASALVATTAAAQPATTSPPAPAASAATAPFDAATSAMAYDPWQPVNRRLFAIGIGADRLVLRPIVHGYMRAPPAVRNRVSAVLFNLGEPSTALEDVLQGHPRRAGRAGVRFVVNSTVGVLGLFDVAGRWGVTGHEADFGQTLGRYGAQPGPYFYIPIVGPLNLRDGLGRVVDVVTDPTRLITGPITSTPGAIRAGATAIDERTANDPAYRALDDATDPYVTTRSAFAQHRAAIVRRATGEAEPLPDFDPGSP